MHAIFATRGIKKHVDEVIKFLETQKFNLPFTLDGKEYNIPLQANLQPIQLWSYVFPKGHEEEVLRSLGFTKENLERWQTGKTKYMIEALRIAMGAKKIPLVDAQGKKLFMPDDAMKYVSFLPIGVKYDDMNWKDPNGTIHEAL